MENRYEYLFPFEKIPAGARVLIYAAGNTGMEYYRQLMMTNYCVFLGFLDRAYEKYRFAPFKVYAPQDVDRIRYDYVVIALKNAALNEKIINDLISYGAKREKIIFIGRRDNVEIKSSTVIDEGVSDGKQLAFHQDGVSLAFKSMTGLGNIIIIKKYLDAILRIEPTCNIDLFITNSEAYVKAVFGENNSNIHHVSMPLEAKYEEESRNYTIAMQYYHLLRIDACDMEKLREKSPQLANLIESLQGAISVYGLTNLDNRDVFIHIMRAKYMERNVYTAAYYGDVLGICDTHVDIPMRDCGGQIESLGLNSYITLNYGTGAENTDSSKQWPYEYFCKFAEMFREKYPAVKIVQLGGAGAKRINGCDKYLLGEDLEFVKHVLKKAYFHLDIEGGLVHLASQLGTRCIVLFGSTQVWYFGYDGNVNIVSPACHGCWRLHREEYSCARGRKKPDCMWSITPDMVMGKVEKIL